jgi:hypothetical protein
LTAEKASYHDQRVDPDERGDTLPRGFRRFAGRYGTGNKPITDARSTLDTFHKQKPTTARKNAPEASGSLWSVLCVYP